MSLQFETTHRFLFRIMRGSGLRMPWIRPQSTLTAISYTINDIFLNLVGINQFVFCTISAFRVTKFQDICALGVTGPLEGTGVAISIFYIIYRKRLLKLVDNWNNLSLRIVNSDLGEADYFKQTYLEVTKNNLSFAKKILFLGFWTPIVYCMPVPIIDAVNHAYRTNLPLRILYPFDDKQPGIYELTLFLHVLGVTTSVIQKIGNDCFFLSLINIQSVYLKWLSASIRSMGEKFKSGDSVIKRKQTEWVKFHMAVLRDVNEVISLFTPTIVVYYFYMIIIVVCGLFTPIKNDHDSPIQGIGVGGFCLVNIFQLYMHSSSAQELTIEAEKLAQQIYNVPWYEVNRSNADMLRLMLLMAKKPVQVTAFKAPTFLLNKETFIGFVGTALTALVTFTQINDLNNAQAKVTT